MVIKKEFVIEFNLLGKQVRTTLYAKSKEDALEELFKSIRAKTKIHFVAELNVGINEFTNVFENMMKQIKDNDNANLQ